jgi:hypothetical protein
MAQLKVENSAQTTLRLSLVTWGKWLICRSEFWESSKYNKVCHFQNLFYCAEVSGVS